MRVLYATAFFLMSFHVPAKAITHTTDFINIFEKHCNNFKNNPQGATTFLESSGINRNAEFEDAYEILIGGIDYAVTPQQMDCTTDVLVKHRNGILFSRTEINNKLKKKFGLKELSSRYFQDIALNNIDTKIQQTDYTSSDGFKYRLLYPLNNQGSYYMTFTIDWSPY